MNLLQYIDDYSASSWIEQTPIGVIGGVQCPVRTYMDYLITGGYANVPESSMDVIEGANDSDESSALIFDDAIYLSNLRMIEVIRYGKSNDSVRPELNFATTVANCVNQFKILKYLNARMCEIYKEVCELHNVYSRNIVAKVMTEGQRKPIRLITMAIFQPLIYDSEKPSMLFTQLAGYLEFIWSLMVQLGIKGAERIYIEEPIGISELSPSLLSRLEWEKSLQRVLRSIELALVNVTKKINTIDQCIANWLCDLPTQNIK
jgi:hypothetical protein